MQHFFRIAQVLILLPCCTAAQFVVPRVVCEIPDSVIETSGLLAVTPNKIYTHNDSGDQPRIYAIDTTGVLLRTIWIGQASAIDYEDITRDPTGNVYIGDFGNNLNLRTDLRIYKITDPELLPGDTATAEVISFNYPDQQLFPPPLSESNFDCESLIYYRDSLYLFSKNRGVSPYSRIYRLPVQPGNYTAVLVDSLYTGKWITAACINATQTALVLLSEKQLWIYKGFSNGDFSNATGTRLEMDSTQKEGITFVNDTVVYISDEQFLGLGGHLYSLSLGEWLRSAAPPENFSVVVISNPSVGKCSLQLKGSASYSVEVFDLLGQLVVRETVYGSNAAFEFSTHLTGILCVRVTSAEGAVSAKTLLVY